MRDTFADARSCGECCHEPPPHGSLLPTTAANLTNANTALLTSRQLLSSIRRLLYFVRIFNTKPTMSTHGKAETERLRKNLEDQLDRLVEQLADIEECRESISEDEYEQTKEETMEQLREFNESLCRMISGDMTLVDHLGAMQLATQSAISAAFETPAVIRMFGKREPDQLKERLASIERDFRLGKLSKDSSERQRGEVLDALKRLGEKLEPAELELLERLSLGGAADASFVAVSENPEKGEIALAIASEEVRATRDT